MNKRYNFWKGRTLREQTDRLLWHRRRRATDREIAAKQFLKIRPYAEIVATENLAEVAAALTAAGPDKAAGPDDARFSDLSVSERWAICRALHHVLGEGSYEPSARRVAELLKRDGGTRSISIRSIVCRIVSTAVYEAMYPTIERVFVPHSYGFVHGKGPWDMLLAVRRDFDTGGKVLFLNDVKKAFDNININLAMEDISRHVTDNNLKDLILRLLRGHSTDVREQADVGVDQGSALSPLTLNILLHYRLDVPLMGTSDPVVHRFADNLAIVAATETQGLECMQRITTSLAAIGMNLKHPVEAADPTSTNPPELLGYHPKLDHLGRLAFGLAETAWDSLREALTEAYQENDPRAHAQSAVSGWCNWCGPALEITRYAELTDRVLSVTAATGLRGIAAEDCRRALQSSSDRWQALQARQRAA